MLPITRTGPSGFVTVELIDLCDAEGFQSRCFGTRPLFPPLQPREGRRPEAELGQHLSQTLRRYSAPSLRLQPPHLFQELRRSVSLACTDNCGVHSYVHCMPLLSSLLGGLQTLTWPHRIHAFQWRQLQEGKTI